MTANVLKVEVVSGLVETTTLENVMVKAIAKGQIKSIADARE